MGFSNFDAVAGARSDKTTGWEQGSGRGAFILFVLLSFLFQIAGMRCDRERSGAYFATLCRSMRLLLVTGVPLFVIGVVPGCSEQSGGGGNRRWRRCLETEDISVCLVGWTQLQLKSYAAATTHCDPGIRSQLMSLQKVPVLGGDDSVGAPILMLSLLSVRTRRREELRSGCGRKGVLWQVSIPSHQFYCLLFVFHILLVCSATERRAAQNLLSSVVAPNCCW